MMIVGSFGDFWRFNGGKEVLSISPVSKILDPASNFLENDFFILRMDLRIKCPDNDSWNFSIDGSTAKCEVNTSVRAHDPSPQYVS